MRSKQAIIVPKNIRLFIAPIVPQIVGATVIDLAGPNNLYYPVGTTSSLVYVPLFTSKYTVDVSGILSVHHINLKAIIFYNDANASCKLQISGDGGNTFFDMTDDLPFGDFPTRSGAGLWINNIEVGEDKLQIRILGKSSDGNPATVRENGTDYIDIYVTKILP